MYLENLRACNRRVEAPQYTSDTERRQNEKHVIDMICLF